MIRVSVLVWTVILALLGIGLFQVKYNVQAKERELREVHRQIEANLTSIHVLQAEWSYLNDPLRLADLARRHTDLQPTTPGQIGDVATLPPRQLDQPGPDAPLIPDELEPGQNAPDATTPPLLSSAPQESAPQEVTSAAPVVPVKAEAEPAPQEIAPAPIAQQSEPKPLKPKDEQAEADAMIDAILADMEKAQGAPDAGGMQ